MILSLHHSLISVCSEEQAKPNYLICRNRCQFKSYQEAISMLQKIKEHTKQSVRCKGEHIFAVVKKDIE